MQLMFHHLYKRQCLNCTSPCVQETQVSSDFDVAILNLLFPSHNDFLLDVIERWLVDCFPFDGKCTIDCPSNYYQDGPSDNRVCLKCQESCKKECPPGSVHSILTAQQYHGCTHITGSFVINIPNQGGCESKEHKNPTN